MLIVDVLLIAALAVFCLCWLSRKARFRPLALLLSASFALIVGLIAFLDDRWQAVVGVCVAGIVLLALLVSRRRKIVPRSVPSRHAMCL